MERRERHRVGPGSSANSREKTWEILRGVHSSIRQYRLQRESLTLQISTLRIDPMFHYRPSLIDSRPPSSTSVMRYVRSRGSSFEWCRGVRRAVNGSVGSWRWLREREREITRRKDVQKRARITDPPARLKGLIRTIAFLKPFIISSTASEGQPMKQTRRRLCSPGGPKGSRARGRGPRKSADLVGSG